MEGLSPLHKVVAGIDVHRMLHVITVLVENEDGTLTKHQQSFGGFKRDMKAMVLWLLELEVERVVMESTGIYWKSAYSHLERAGIFAMVDSVKEDFHIHVQHPIITPAVTPSLVHSLMGIFARHLWELALA